MPWSEGRLYMENLDEDSEGDGEDEVRINGKSSLLGIIAFIAC